MNTKPVTDESQIYQLDKLMEETRSLAAKYRAATGQTLPVSHDLACYDAMRLLGLSPPQQVEAAIDAEEISNGSILKYTIKGRVQFIENRGKQQRIGQLNMDADWHACLLVLLDDEYQTKSILKATKDVILTAIESKPLNKRGIMTVAQFHKLAELVWQSETVLQAPN